VQVKYVKTLVQGDDGLDGEACVTLALCLCREVLKADGSVSERRAVQREYAKVSNNYVYSALTREYVGPLVHGPGRR
jgi:hypothetical protein